MSREKCKRFVPDSGWLLLMLVTGGVLRLYGAWCMQHHFAPDAGIAALMARHIAEGREWPVFFYGQPYMGSFEPTVSALFCLLLGPTGLAVSLGTALVAFLLLPVLYCWARDACDKTAGLFAMAFCLIGPQGFFHYNHSPRGGYAATLLFSALCLWLSARMVQRFRQSQTIRTSEFIVLGLSAGLGWWTNQLILSALLAAAVLMALTLRFRLFSLKTVYAFLAFLAGSAPFWIYNWRHGWPTFSFAGSFGSVPVTHGLRLFFSKRLISLLDINAPGWILQIYFCGLVLALLVYAGCAIRLRRAGRDQAVYHLAIGLFILFSAVLFSTSHFALISGASRYLLPLVPAFGVIFGAAMSRLARRCPAGAVLLTILLAASQSGSLAWARAGLRKDTAYMSRCQMLLHAALPSGRTNLLAEYACHGLNFALAEKILVADIDRERYPPYAARIEAADDVCILGNYDEPSLFFDRWGGQGRFAEVSGFPAHYDLQAPARNLAPIAPADIEYAVDAHGRDVRFLVTNAWINHSWRSREKEAPDWLEVSFRTNQPVAMLRLYALQREEYPGRWRIEGQADGQSEWRELVPLTGFKHYYWSGNRLFYGGDHYRFEVFLPAVNLKKIRISNYPERPDWWWSARLLQLFAPGTPRPDEREAAPALCGKLTALGVKTLYCDRYAANKLAVLSSGAIRTPRDSYVQPQPRDEIGRVRVDCRTAFAVRQEDAALSRHALRSRYVPCVEHAVPPWVIFQVAENEGIGDHPEAAGLFWTGFSLVLRDDENIEYWNNLLRRAERRLQAGRADALTEAMLKTAINEYPGNYNHPAQRLLADLFAQCGETQAAQDLRAEIRAMTEPGLPAAVRFGNGVEFLGLGGGEIELRPGGRAALAYYWTCPPDIDKNRCMVFVHFLDEQDQILLQDDHVLLEHCPGWVVRNQSDKAVFMYKREMAVPPDVPDGKIRLYFGLYDRSSGKRIQADSALPQLRDGVLLPVSAGRQSARIN